MFPVAIETMGSPLDSVNKKMSRPNFGAKPGTERGKMNYILAALYKCSPSLQLNFLFSFMHVYIENESIYGYAHALTIEITFGK